MQYVICIDKQRNSQKYPVKIHKVTSWWYRHKKENAETMTWTGIFETAIEAEKYARNTGRSWKWAQGQKP